MMNNHSAPSSALDAFASCPPYHQPWGTYAPSQAPDSWTSHSCPSLYTSPVSHQYHHHHQLAGHHHADAFAVHQYHAAAHPYSSIGYGYMTASSSPSSPTRHPEIITTVESANLTLTPPSSDPSSTVIKGSSSPIHSSPNGLTSDQTLMTTGDFIKSEGVNGEAIEDTNSGNHMSGRPQPARSPYEWMNKKSSAYSSGSLPPPGKTRTRDKYRVVYSDHQRQELELEFRESRYITIRRKAELAQNLQLSERQVKIWFQNRRAKERKQSKKKDDGSSKKEKMSLNSPNDSLPPHLHHHLHGGSPPLGPPNHVMSNHHYGNGNAKIHDSYGGIIHHHHPHLICSPPNFGGTSVPLSSIQPQY